MSDAAIHFDFATGRVSNAGLVERLGMALLRMGARLSAPMNNVGYSIGARLVRSVLRSQRTVRVDLGGGALFEFPYGDGYWGVLLNNKQGYAPPIERLLQSLRDEGYVFIDCGANFGYMSVLVTSAGYGAKPAIAIEADNVNFMWLSNNSAINGNRFECRHNAVFSQGGQVLQLYGAKHEALSLVEEAGGGIARGEVTTLALDDLLDWVSQYEMLPIILKLDIEGVELDALAGGKELLARQCLLIYEEHGNDPEHTLSRHLRDERGMVLFAEPDSGGGLIEVNDWAFLDRFKRNKRVGYDLFATNSEHWLPLLRARCANTNTLKGAAA